MGKLVLFSALWGAAQFSYAVETRYWQHTDRADFEKGTFKRVSLASDGRLLLAPAFKELHDSSMPYLWAVAADSRGNLFAGGGGPGASTAKVFLIDENGKFRVLSELEGMQIQAITVDRRNRVYAATSPDGKVWRVPMNGKPEVLYDPKAKYIWALAVNSKGEVFVGTGDRGEIHRVAPDGKGSVFFSTEESHARSLAVDAKDNLIVGTEPGGLVLRVSPGGEGFVLHQANKREVTSVAVARDGSIYAAAVGNKQPAVSAPAPTAAPTPPPTTGTPAPAGPAPGAQRAAPGPPPPPPSFAAAPAISGGSEVYRIDTEGYARKVWSDTQEIAYAIGFDSSGLPLVGTGNKGNIYRLDSDIAWTLLLNAAPTQVTGFAAGRDGKVFAVTGNIGKIYQIGPGLEKDGSFESEVLDATFFSYWGRLTWHGDAGPGKVAFEARSGNLDRPQKNWSSWTPVSGAADGGKITAPPARFLQYKATLAASPAGGSPHVTAVDVAYLPRNVAPVIEQIEVTPSNYRFPQQSLALTPSQNITLPPLGQRKSASSTRASEGGSVSMQYAKGHAGTRWLARDENGDDLLFKAEIRGAQETEWKLLKDKIKERYVSWDSTAFPDGEYRIRVTASDAPDNPPGHALTQQLTSEPFIIDNTPPQVIGLGATRSGNRLTVRWKARDARSVVDKAEYSLDGGEWLVVEPVGKLSDSMELDYTLSLDAGASAEHTIAVRVTDEFENQSVEKVVVR